MRRRAGLNAAGAAVLALLLAAAAAAQTPAPADSARTPEASRRRALINPRLADPDAAGRSLSLPARRPSLAEELFRAQHELDRDPARALARLEDLSARYPGNAQQRFLRARALSALGRPADAAELLRELVRETPAALGYRRELLRALLLAGEEAAADSLLEQSLAAERPSAGNYEQVAGLLQDLGRYDQVEAVYRRGLRDLPAADASGRARLVQRLLDHLLIENRPADLLRELARGLDLVGDETQRRRLLKRGQQLLRDVEAPGALLGLADSLRATPAGAELGASLRGLYLAAGQLDAYAELVLAAPVPASQRGYVLHDEGMRCLESRQASEALREDAAERLFRAALDASPPRDLASRLRWRLASIALDRDARARLRGEAPGAGAEGEILASLRDLRTAAPGSSWASEALVAELRYLRERLQRPAVADSLLRDWLVNPERGGDAESQWALELELGETLLARDRFAPARAHFQMLTQASRATVLRSWARYRLALLAAADGEFTAAQDSLSALAKEQPGSALANDALDAALLLAESQAWPESVREFLRGALRLELRARPDLAADRILAFTAEFPEDPAAAPLLYRAGRLYELAYRGEAAIAAWTQLADLHGEDFRAPQGLELAARLALRAGDAPRARALLDRLLADYPDSPLRPSLRDLEARLAKEA